MGNLRNYLKDDDAVKYFHVIRERTRSGKESAEIYGANNDSTNQLQKYEKNKKPMTAVEFMKLYQKQKEKEYRKVVNSPFTAYKMKYQFHAYKLMKQKKALLEDFGLEPIEGSLQPFNKEFPTKKHIYHIKKSLNSERMNYFRNMLKARTFLN